MGTKPMPFATVQEQVSATAAWDRDATYARNIFNGATKHRPTDGLKAHLEVVSEGMSVVVIRDSQDKRVGYLAWEWFVIHIVATVAMPQGFRVSLCPCAPGFDQVSADETAERQGNPAVGKVVSYTEWLKAHNGGLNGHAKTNNPADPYTVEPWVS